MSGEQPELVNKSTAALRWGISRSMIPRYIAWGMPTEPDGRLNWVVVAKWRANNITPSRSGSYYSRQRKVAEISKARTPAKHVNLSSQTPEVGQAVQIIAPPEEQSAVDLLHRLTSIAAQLELGRKLRTCFGFTAEHARAAAEWVAFCVLWETDGADDIEGDPTHAQWVGAVGEHDQMAYEDWYDRCDRVETEAKG